MKTINLMPDEVQLILPMGLPFEENFTFAYSITGYTYTAKIVDSEYNVIATLTCTPDTLNNIVTMSISQVNSLLIETEHRWYLKETRSASNERIVAFGKVQNIQVTDL